MKHDRMSDALGKIYKNVQLLRNENTYLYVFYDKQYARDKR